MIQHVKAGSVNLLAVTSDKRSSLFPDVPTVAEAGVPNYNISTWWGVLAPAGTPEPIVTRLNKAVNEVASAEPLKGRLVSEGAEPFTGTPADFGKTLSAELAMWKDTAKAANLKAVE
jgi:tripartite-type tricarboxylate transporter receptor subunit TctC